VTLFSDLTDFLYSHRPHGRLTAHATEPAWNGYLLTVACPCGVVFERWVTPGDAEVDLLRAAGLN
jgi:hypothetical protein